MQQKHRISLLPWKPSQNTKSWNDRPHHSLSSSLDSLLSFRYGIITSWIISEMIFLWKKTSRLGERLQISLRCLCNLWVSDSVTESLSHPLVRDRIRDSICVRHVHVLTASVQCVHMRVHHGGVLGVVHHQGHFLSGAQSFLPLLRQLPADTKKSWSFNKVFFPQTLIFSFFIIY